MRNTILKLFIIFSAVFSFNACEFEQEKTYSFAYSLMWALEKEESEEPIKKYFEDRLDFKNTFSFTGRQADVMALANERFINEVEANINHDEVLDLLGEKDIVELDLYMIFDKGKSVISAISWYHTDETEEKVEE